MVKTFIQYIKNINILWESLVDFILIERCVKSVTYPLE